VVEQRNGFTSWLNRIRLLLGISGVIVGTIAIAVLGYAAMQNDLSSQAFAIVGHTGEIKELQVRVDLHGMGILKVQTQLDMMQQSDQKNQEEIRRSFREILEKLKQTTNYTN